MAHQKLDRRARRDALDVRLQKRLLAGADDVKRVVGIASDHVEVDVQDERARLDRRILDERAGALEPGFLAVERREDQRVRRGLGLEMTGQREERGRAGRVVVGAVVDLAVGRDADVIVVRRDDDVPARLSRAVDAAHDVGAGAAVRCRPRGGGAETRARTTSPIGARPAALKRSITYARALSPPGVPARRPCMSSADSTCRSREQLRRIEQIAARGLRVADGEPGERYRKNGQPDNRVVSCVTGYTAALVLLHLGVFLITLSGLVFEVALTRIYSATIWYHFAFVAVSVALLGWGLGGFGLHLLRKRDARRRSTRPPCSRCSTPRRFRRVWACSCASRSRSNGCRSTSSRRSCRFFLAGMALSMVFDLHRAARRVAVFRGPARRVARRARRDLPAPEARRRGGGHRRRGGAAALAAACLSSPRMIRGSGSASAPPRFVVVVSNERTAGLFHVIARARSRRCGGRWTRRPGARVTQTRLERVLAHRCGRRASSRRTSRGSTSTPTPGRASCSGTAESKACATCGRGIARFRSRCSRQRRRRSSSAPAAAPTSWSRSRPAAARSPPSS